MCRDRDSAEIVLMRPSSQVIVRFLPSLLLVRVLRSWRWHWRSGSKGIERVSHGVQISTAVSDNKVVLSDCWYRMIPACMIPYRTLRACLVYEPARCAKYNLQSVPTNRTLYNVPASLKFGRSGQASSGFPIICRPFPGMNE